MTENLKLNEYGEVLAAYKGTGTLERENSSSLGCAFQALQLRDGNIIVQCNLPDNTIERIYPHPGEVQLKGATSEGNSLVATELLRTSNLPSSSSCEAEPHVVYFASALDVTFNPEAKPTFSKFAARIFGVLMATPIEPLDFTLYMASM
jgi:hypothetical protein